MYRHACFAAVVAGCLAAAAHANPIVSIGNWKINNAPGQSIDLYTGNPIAVMIETAGGPPDDAIEGVTLALSVNDLITGPLIESVTIGAGSIFDANSTSSGGFIFGTLPARHAVATQTTSVGTVDAGDGAGGPAVLAFLSFDATGVTPGTYPIYLNDPTIPVSTNIPSFTTTLLDGSVTMDSFDEGGMYGMMTVVPEPASLVLALIAAAGFCAAAIARRRKGG